MIVYCLLGFPVAFLPQGHGDAFCQDYLDVYTTQQHSTPGNADWLTKQRRIPQGFPMYWTIFSFLIKFLITLSSFQLSCMYAILSAAGGKAAA